MNAEQLDTFKGLLEARLQALLQSAGATLEELSEQHAELTGSQALHTTDSHRDFSLRLQARERALMRRIQEALARIEDDSYGICVACGAEIGHRRLLARPMATHCIDCKTEVDLSERPRPTPL